MAPLFQQKLIVDFIQNEIIRIKNTIALIQQQIELMQEYKTSLINEVVTGKVRVV
jgi:type I restriction enzyme S subunit